MPLLIFSLWSLAIGTLCFTCPPFRLAFFPLALYPLLFRPVFALLRRLRQRHCLLRLRRGRLYLEFDGSVRTGHLNRQALRLFRLALAKCLGDAIHQGQTVIVESHLLTEWRYRALCRALPENVIAVYHPRTTPLSDVFFIRLLTLLAEWRWASVSRSGGRLIVLPGRQNHVV